MQLLLPREKSRVGIFLPRFCPYAAPAGQWQSGPAELSSPRRAQQRWTAATATHHTDQQGINAAESLWLMSNSRAPFAFLRGTSTPMPSAAYCVPAPRDEPSKHGHNGRDSREGLSQRTGWPSAPPPSLFGVIPPSVTT